MADASDPRACGPRRFPDGNPTAVLRTAVDALRAGRRPVLAIVVETIGSTYAGCGTLALFGDAPRTGWISGGCVEPDIARAAAAAADSRTIEWLEIDTLDDEAMFSGSAQGCRGQQLLALLPLVALPGAEHAMQAWLGGAYTLMVTLQVDGAVHLRLDGRAWSWTLRPGHTPERARQDWTLALPRAPKALILGAGPEMPALAPLLRSLGWRVMVCEHRARWREAAGTGLPILELAPEDAVAAHPDTDVALVMHHGFEADRDALAALAGTRIPWIGLLGPARRRADLFKLLRAPERDALAGRLNSPVGLPGCGRGPEAIALSIAAQLQQWRSAQQRP